MKAKLLFVPLLLLMFGCAQSLRQPTTDTFTVVKVDAPKSSTRIPQPIRLRFLDQGRNVVNALGQLLVLDGRYQLLASGDQDLALNSSAEIQEIRFYGTHNGEAVVARGVIPANTAELYLVLHRPATIRFFKGEENPSLNTVSIDLLDGHRKVVSFNKNIAQVDGLIPNCQYRFSLGEGYQGQFLLRTPAAGETMELPIFRDSKVPMKFVHKGKVLRFSQMRVDTPFDQVQYSPEFVGDRVIIPQSLFGRSFANRCSLLDESGEVLADFRPVFEAQPDGRMIVRIPDSGTRGRYIGRLLDSQGQPVPNVESTSGVVTDSQGRFYTRERRITFLLPKGIAKGFIRGDKKEFGEIQVAPYPMRSLSVKSDHFTSFRADGVEFPANQSIGIRLDKGRAFIEIEVGPWRGKLYPKEEGEIIVDLTPIKLASASLENESGDVLPYHTLRMVWTLANFDRQTRKRDETFSLSLEASFRSNSDAVISGLMPPLKETTTRSFETEIGPLGRFGIAPSKRWLKYDEDRKTLRFPSSRHRKAIAKEAPKMLYGKRIGLIYSTSVPLHHAGKRFDSRVGIDKIRISGKQSGYQMRNVPGGYVTRGDPARPFIYHMPRDRVFALVGEATSTAFGMQCDLDLATLTGKD